METSLLITLNYSKFQWDTIFFQFAKVDMMYKSVDLNNRGKLIVLNLKGSHENAMKTHIRVVNEESTKFPNGMRMISCPDCNEMTPGSMDGRRKLANF